LARGRLAYEAASLGEILHVAWGTDWHLPASNHLHTIICR